MAKNDDDRNARLAAGLRENLVRRKARARGMATADVPAAGVGETHDSPRTGPK